MTSSYTLRISAIQSNLLWEDPDANMKHLQKSIFQMDKKEVDLLILPEMFTTGFTMNAFSLAEKPIGKTVDWMSSIAGQLSCAVTGSIIIREKDQYYNRLYFVWPDGRHATYDKRHTFSYAGEDKVYSRGKERLIVEYKGWRICPLICYDLRFPVWSRNTVDFDVLIYVANWPESRIAAWDTLLRARAIENMCYTIGVDRIGQDGNGIYYVGHSAVYNPRGHLCGRLSNGREGVLSGVLDKNELIEIRNQYRFLEDRDDFELKNN